MLEVEIKGPYNQFYKAFLCNILEDVAIVSLKDDSKSTHTIPFSFLYNVSIEKCPTHIKIGDNVEVYIQPNSTIPICPSYKKLSNDDEQLFSKLAIARNQLAWWPAQVQNIRGDYLVVRIADIASCTDVVEKTIVRAIVPCNDDSGISKSGETRRHIDYGSVSKRVIHIPQELSQCSRDVYDHKELLRYCSSPATLYYDEKKSQLNVFAFDADVIRKIDLLEDTYLKMLRQKWNLMQSMDHATKRLESTRLANNKSANFVESFSIPQVCMGLAIGSKGVNIQQARHIDNVVAVEVCDEMCTFVIYAKTKEAIKAARKILEYSEAVVEVPQRLVARIIGKNGSNMQSMVDKSGVIRVRIENNERPFNKNTNRRPMKSRDGTECDLVKTSNIGPSSSSTLKTEKNKTALETIEPIRAELEETGSNKDVVNFVFIGTLESISNAELLINFQVETLQELDMIQAEKEEIIRELHSVEYQSLQHPCNQHPSSSYSISPNALPSRPAYNPPSNFGNPHLIHPVRFPSNGNPFPIRQTGQANFCPRYPGRFSTMNSVRLKSEFPNNMDDEYSLAPGGPPSGSLMRGRHNARFPGDVEGHLEQSDRGRHTRPQSHYGTNGRPEGKRSAGGCKAGTQVTNNEVSAGARVSLRM